MSQNAQVLSYLKRWGSLTPLQALRELGTLRLGARIFDLREMGHRIETEHVTVKTRAGKARVARYRLI
jgi:hypothetical protein